jgi:hypothetical protein
LSLAAIGIACPGCLERTIRVTSDPPGALVWLNDVEIGRTPAEARFKFYGTYDVRLELTGYEPVHAGRDAKAPFYEYPGPDAIAAALPMRLHNVIEWHFDLDPSPPSRDPAAEAEMVARARELREQLGPGAEVDEPAEEPEHPEPEGSQETEAPAPAPTIEPVPTAPGR